MRLALDLGYSNVKLVYGRSRQEMTQAIFPASAAPLDQRDKTITGRVEGGITVPVDGVPYSAFVDAGRFQDYSRPLHEDYIRSASYKALFLASLQILAVDEVDEVVTGLPTKHYRDPAFRDALVRLMSGAHKVGPHQTVNVRKVTVVAQPVGAYVDYMVNAGPEAVMQSNVLVVDPGFGSTDWALIHRTNLREGASGSSFQAMSVILESAAKAINADLGSRITLDPLEMALREGRSTIFIYGEERDIRPYLDRAADQVVAKVIDHMLGQSRTEAGHIDMVLLTGGGAQFYKGAVERAITGPKIEVMPDAVFSNARGFFLGASAAFKRKAAA